MLNSHTEEQLASHRTVVTVSPFDGELVSSNQLRAVSDVITEVVVSDGIITGFETKLSCGPIPE